MRKFRVKVEGKGLMIKVCNLVNGEPDGNWKSFPLFFEILDRTIENTDLRNREFKGEDVREMWENGEIKSGIVYCGEEIIYKEDDMGELADGFPDDDDDRFKTIEKYILEKVDSQFAVAYSNKVCYITSLYEIELNDDEDLNIEDLFILKTMNEVSFIPKALVADRIMYKGNIIEPVLVETYSRSIFRNSLVQVVYQGEVINLREDEDYQSMIDENIIKDFEENFTTFKYENPKKCKLRLDEYAKWRYYKDVVSKLNKKKLFL